VPFIVSAGTEETYNNNNNELAYVEEHVEEGPILDYYGM